MEYALQKTAVILFVFSLSTPTAVCNCPSSCVCIGGNRVVDCSQKNLITIPARLQNDITSLNLSHNQIKNLNNMTTNFSHLRILDISYNLLSSLPENLPKSLWELYAANNNIEIVQKDDIAYQWNLKILDLSNNNIHRITLINNTLSSLQSIRMNGNRLWTVPTNLPNKLIMIDLSNNNLNQILPSSLDRMLHLENFYLHNNKFSNITTGAFDQLPSLMLITLYNNSWKCNHNDINYLLTWLNNTNAFIAGCPCSSKLYCGNYNISAAATSTLATVTYPYTARETNGHTLLTTTLSIPVTAITSQVTLSKYILSDTSAMTARTRQFTIHISGPPETKTTATSRNQLTLKTTTHNDKKSTHYELHSSLATDLLTSNSRNPTLGSIMTSTKSKASQEIPGTETVAMQSTSATTSSYQPEVSQPLTSTHSTKKDSTSYKTERTSENAATTKMLTDPNTTKNMAATVYSVACIYTVAISNMLLLSLLKKVTT
ncbi:oligodendrocyte-myelin glycoprotein isoform X2 [Protopterus annectens]|nr:oligodendrocyte-myelin glycoprotein isoform X2 [Protopterus annectens]